MASGAAGAATSLGAFATANAGMMGLASAGVSGLGAIAGHMGASQEAAATEAAFKQNSKNALTAYQGDIESANLDTMASQEAATGRRMDASAQGLAARSAALTSGGERGMGGLSMSALLGDIGMSEGSDIANINRNDQLDNSRHRLATKGAQGAAQSRINSAPRGKKPSLLALGASLTGSALSGMQMTSSIKAAAGP
jgi:hypothetical protein